MGALNREHQILQDALATLQEIVDLKAKVLPLLKTNPLGHLAGRPVGQAALKILARKSA